MRKFLIVPLLLTSLTFTACGNSGSAVVPTDTDGPANPINDGDSGIFQSGGGGAAPGNNGSGNGSGNGSSGGNSNSLGNEPQVHGGGSQPVPEPGTLLLVGSGLAGVGASLLRRRRKQAKA